MPSPADARDNFVSAIKSAHARTLSIESNTNDLALGVMIDFVDSIRSEFARVEENYATLVARFSDSPAGQERILSMLEEHLNDDIPEGISVAIQDARTKRQAVIASYVTTIVPIHAGVERRFDTASSGHVYNVITKEQREAFDLALADLRQSLAAFV